MNQNTQPSTSNATSAAAGAGTETMDRIASSAHKSIDAASKAAHPTIDRAADSAHKVVENADHMLHSAAEHIDRAGAKGEEMISVGTGYMREHPLLTLGLAVTAGYLLSRLVASR